MLCGSCLFLIRIAGREEKDVGHRKDQKTAHPSIKEEELAGSNKSLLEEEPLKNETRIEKSMRVFILFIKIDNFDIEKVHLEKETHRPMERLAPISKGKEMEVGE